MLPLVSIGFALSACSSDAPVPAPSLPSTPVVGPVKYAPLDPSVAARAAIVLGSCVPDDKPSRILERMYTTRDADDVQARVYQGATQCLATKGGGCQALVECLSMLVDLSGPCADSCEGDVSSACDSALHFRVNCARFGMKCDPKELCLAPSASACNPATFVPSCDGDVPSRCVGGHVMHGIHCAEFGLDCHVAGTPVPPATKPPAGCSGAGTTCTGSGGPILGLDLRDSTACDGSRIKQCIDGLRGTFDCATFGTGFSCQTIGPFGFCGRGADCKPGSATPATCDGDSVVICNAGRSEKIDCKSLGFTGCDPGSGVCTPSPMSPPK